MQQKKELSYTRLKSVCNKQDFGFDTTDELIPLEGIIGQERAVRAFDFGLQVKQKGYNIYMSGPAGTGKTTYAVLSTEKIAKTEATPKDWCYVYNFENPRSPIALRFDSGVGRQFRDDMSELVEVFNTEIQKAFNSDDYDSQKNQILKTYDDKRDVLMKTMSDLATENGFSLKSTNSGIFFLPIINGETITEDKYDELDEKTKELISKGSDAISEKIAVIMRNIKDLEKESRKKTDDLDYKVCMFAIGHYVNMVQEKYKNYERVIKYLEAVQEDVLENIDHFIEEDNEEEDTMAALLPGLSKNKTEDITLKYKVNLIIDNSTKEGAPVIVDFNPTYYNLIGEVEYDNEFGNLITDFMKIKAGLFHKANGGYLIVQAQDLLSNVQAWEAVRRVIKTNEISIENLREQIGAVAVTTLKPEPIVCDVKVILIGNNYYYELLRGYDEDFSKLFKIRADFDYEMSMSSENILSLARFVRSHCLKENIMPFDSGAVAKIVENASRLVESQKKLSTRFNHISETISEAATWASIDGKTLVTEEYVNKAIYEREQRLRMYRDKISESFDDEIVLIDTVGKAIGEINGLAVFDLGDYAFGNPSRITATTYIGKSGIVNIEKEAEMSGPTHDKGVQIITGYLGSMYAQDFPLSLSCRICFEQNYNGIDGDSASSTELYCILSSLAELPINHQLAVTGSVNQKGEIQAIGGVTYKIEGFFDLCKRRTLTGNQGVIIPESNINDLVLNDEVIEAVRDGKFHIYPISNINEGIELLMDTPAGTPDKNGKYLTNTVHGRVMKKLKEYNKKANGDGQRR